MENKIEEKIKSNSNSINILSPITLGGESNPLQLRNRVAMAALTRSRADEKTRVPNELHVKYYSERAEDAGFILTECSSVSRRGNSLFGSCGIWSDEQVSGWKNVCEAVHEVNGRIFLQIWHCGRAARSDILEGEKPMGPSAIQNRHPCRTSNGLSEFEVPQEMSKQDIEEVKEQFRKGAENAKLAGFDGLQLHGANGYLIDEFLRDATNTRTDEYGGSIENRCKFPLEVIDILISVFGASRVGIKISPVGRLNDMFDSDPINLYTYFIGELNKRKIAFVEIMRAPEFRPVPNYYGITAEEQITDLDMYKIFRPVFCDGILIANNSFDYTLGNKIVEEGLVDMVSYGRSYISNPDLVQRFRNNWPLTKPNEKTYYVPGAVGYIDYPKYEESQESQEKQLTEN